MDNLIPITYLNDFVFCPYSIYLHQVFDNNEDIVYKAEPQQEGKAGHRAIDEPKTQKNNVIKGIYVLSHELGIFSPPKKAVSKSRYSFTCRKAFSCQ